MREESLPPQVCEAPARVPLRKVSPPSAVPSRVCPILFRLPWAMATGRASWGRKAASEGRDAEFALNAAARGCRACAHRLRPGQGLSVTWMEGLLGVGAPSRLPSRCQRCHPPAVAFTISIPASVSSSALWYPSKSGFEFPARLRTAGAAADGPFCC